MTLKIIAYHGVWKSHEHNLLNFDGRHLSQTAFERQLVFFKKNFSVLSAEQLRECFLRQKLPKKALLLTFDDAYYNFFENAFPLLQKHSLPCLLFVPTGLIGKQCFLPQEMLLCAIEKSAKKESKKQKLLEYFRLREKLLALLKTNQKKARSFLDSEIEKFGFSSKELLDDDFRLLDWKQLKQIASSNLVDFGSHTKSHIPLAGLSKTKIKPELFSSKSEIERKLQRDCFSFAYPFGSFDDSAVKEAQKLFFFSFTTQFGEALLDSNRALLPRISLNNNYNSLFPATVSIDLPGIHSAAYKKILALNKNKRLV